jgi:hypothetical protein
VTSGWERDALATLFHIPIWVDDDGAYGNGQHCAQAMLDAGVPNTVVPQQRREQYGPRRSSRAARAALDEEPPRGFGFDVTNSYASLTPSSPARQLASRMRSAALARPARCRRVGAFSVAVGGIQPAWLPWTLRVSTGQPGCTATAVDAIDVKPPTRTISHIWHSL